MFTKYDKETFNAMRIAMKNDIKMLAEEQRELKNQRRTVRLVGERTMTPYMASCKIEVNKCTITSLIHSYRTFLGRGLEENETQDSIYLNKMWFRNFCDKYEKIVCSNK